MSLQGGTGELIDALIAALEQVDLRISARRAGSNERMTLDSP